jgi:branched-chain amino acid aminotransferase
MAIKTYAITPAESLPVDSNAATLDEMTRVLPEGFYTTFTTLAGGTKVFGLQSHLDRLYVPARELGLNPRVEERILREQIALLVKQNLPKESRVRIILAKDSGAIHVGIQYSEPPPEIIYSRGVNVITTEMARKSPDVKDSGFIASSSFERRQIGSSVFEVLMTKNGRVLEGMTSNFYGIKQKTIITANRGILPGVTRKAVLKLAKGQGMSIKYRAPRINENFSEAFLTSSSRGVVPIISIDDRRVGDGRVGEQTKSLSKAYQDYVEKRSELLVNG